MTSDLVGLVLVIDACGGGLAGLGTASRSGCFDGRGGFVFGVSLGGGGWVCAITVVSFGFDSSGLGMLFLAFFFDFAGLGL